MIFGEGLATAGKITLSIQMQDVQRKISFFIWNMKKLITTTLILPYLSDKNLRSYASCFLSEKAWPCEVKLLSLTYSLILGLTRGNITDVRLGVKCYIA
jgi:hypothetical protein